MPDSSTSCGRPLSDGECQLFNLFGLSAGNWAALVATPFYHRFGIRPVNLHQRADGQRLETLRRELRTASGLTEETIRFWKRLGSGTADLAEAGLRLLAWHLASDISFGKRERVLYLITEAARELLNGARMDADRAMVEDLRLLIDYYLPCQRYPGDVAPRWTYVPLPSTEAVCIIALNIASPSCTWPVIAPEQVAAQLPTLVRLLGEPITDWWGQPSVGRRAVDRGMAALSFAERERLYGELALEWQRVQPPDQVDPLLPAPDSIRPGAALVAGIHEWVDAVRKFTRLGSVPSEPKAVAVGSAVRMLPAALESPVSASLPAAPLGTRWSCQACGIENSALRLHCKGCTRARPAIAVELRSSVTGKTMRLEDGMRVGRTEYREMFGLPEAGLAAADQFEVVYESAVGAWRILPLSSTRYPTRYAGEEVKPDGCVLTEDGVISVGEKLELTVRFER